MTTGDRRREKDRRESMRCRRRALALVACFLLSGGAPFNEKKVSKGRWDANWRRTRASRGAEGGGGGVSRAIKRGEGK